MAVTIHTSPNLYTPSDSPIVWTFSSTNTAQPNFSYIIEVFVSGVLDSRHLIFPESGIYAHFDASEIMQSRCSQANTLVGAVVQDAENWNSCYIKVNEFYGATPSLGASNTSSTIYPFKAVVSDELIGDWDYTDYTILDSTKLFLTEFNRDSFRIMRYQTLFLQIITNLANAQLRIKYYDSDDVLIGTQNETISNTIRICQITLNSETYLNTTYFNQSSYFVVDIWNGITERSEPITVYIDPANNCDTFTRVTWLNHLGGYDSFTFNHNLTTKTDIQSFEFQKQLGRWDGSSFLLDASASGYSQYFKTIKDGGTIVSGWLTEEQQNSLVKLYESPLTLMELSGLVFSKFTVLNSSYLPAQSRFDELFNEIVEYKMSNPRKSPRL